MVQASLPDYVIIGDVSGSAATADTDARAWACNKKRPGNYENMGGESKCQKCREEDNEGDGESWAGH